MPRRVGQRAARLDRALDRSIDLDRLLAQRDLAAADPADVEQVVDQPRQLGQLPVDDAARPFVRGIAVRLDAHQVERIADRRQRIAQLVPEHREKFVHLALALLQRHDAFALGHVAGHFGKAAQLAVGIEQRRDDDVGPERRPVLAQAPAFVLEAADARGDFQLHLREFGVDCLLRVEARKMFADDFLGLVALDGFGPLVPGRDPALRIEHEHGVVPDTADQQTEFFLAAPELVLELGAHDDILPQRLICLLELLRPKAHAQLELVARLVQRLHRPPALTDDGAQHQSGDRNDTDEREQEQQRRIDRGRRERAAADNRVDDRYRAQGGDRGRHFELVEAQRGPDDQRKGKQQQRGGDTERGHAAAEHDIAGGGQHQREQGCFDFFRGRPRRARDAPSRTGSAARTR